MLIISKKIMNFEKILNKNGKLVFNGSKIKDILKSKSNCKLVVRTDDN